MFSLLAFDPTINFAFIALGAASLVVGWRAWHGWMGANEQDARRMWGQALWPAMMRAMPVCSAMMASVCAAALALSLSPHSSGPLGAAWDTLIVTPLVVVWVVTSILYFCVLLTNRPRILIPPMHRGDLSLWSERRAKSQRSADRR